MLHSEFEVQAEAYQQLKEVFPVVRGEYQVINNRGRNARLDIAIFDELDNLILAIEVKKRSTAKRDSKQMQRYRELLDCPVLLIAGMNEANNAVKLSIAALYE